MSNSYSATSPAGPPIFGRARELIDFVEPQIEEVVSEVASRFWLLSRRY